MSESEIGRVPGGWEALAEVLVALRALYGRLCRTSYPDEGQDAFHSTCTEILGVALRAMLAARSNIEHGFVPESDNHVRTAWELLIDLGYMLGRRGSARRDLALQYRAAQMLRSPAMAEHAADPDSTQRERFPEAFERYEALKAAFPDDRLADPRRHWSLEDKGVVRKEAYEELESGMDEKSVGLMRRSKELIFDQGSRISHGDPGGRVEVRRDHRGYPDLDAPVLLSGHQTMNAIIVGTCLFAGGARLAGGKFATEAQEIMGRMHQVVVDATELSERHAEESARD